MKDFSVKWVFVLFLFSLFLVLGCNDTTSPSINDGPSNVGSSNAGSSSGAQTPTGDVIADNPGQWLLVHETSETMAGTTLENYWYEYYLINNTFYRIDTSSTPMRVYKGTWSITSKGYYKQDIQESADFAELPSQTMSLFWASPKTTPRKYDLKPGQYSLDQMSGAQANTVWKTLEVTPTSPLFDITLLDHTKNISKASYRNNVMCTGTDDPRYFPLAQGMHAEFVNGDNEFSLFFNTDNSDSDVYYTVDTATISDDGTIVYSLDSKEYYRGGYYYSNDSLYWYGGLLIPANPRGGMSWEGNNLNCQVASTMATYSTALCDYTGLVQINCASGQGVTYALYFKKGLGLVAEAATINGLAFPHELAYITIPGIGSSTDSSQLTFTDDLSSGVSSSHLVSTLSSNATILGSSISGGDANILNIPDYEYQALLDFYNSTGGPDWKDNTGWLDNTQNKWFGVTISGGHVTKIRFSQNDLIGLLPNTICNLGNLQYLSLDFNDLTGAIPDSIHKLENLVELSILSNSLSGTLPSGMGSLSRLEELNLRQNNIEGSIPNSFGDLAQLTSLSLSYNSLSGEIPDTLGNLSNLEELGLEFIDFTPGPIPQWIGDLTNLERLNLRSTNRTGEIPEFLSNLSQLKVLDLFINELTGSVPDFLGNMKELWILELGRNNLIGALPASLGNLRNLENLGLNDNEITGPFPQNWENLNTLEFVTLQNMRIDDTIPSYFGSFTNLRVLYMHNSGIKGTIPDTLKSMNSLTILDLSVNELTGGFPLSLTELDGLKHLELDSNKLAGAVPKEIMNLTQLRSFKIDENDLCIDKNDSELAFFLYDTLQISAVLDPCN